jgi:SH3 domain-containing YSC84-like protein 1
MRRIALVACVLLTGVATAMAVTPAEELHKANNVLNEIMSAPDHGIPDDLLAKAVCVGIVPAELKFAIGVGGTYGRGVLVCRRGGVGAWGAPSMFTLGGGSFGFQLGGQATDVVFIVMNPDGARKLIRDSVKLGGDISAAAGPLGRDGQAATDAEMHAEVLSYSRTRGLFAGVSLEGAVLKQDNGENRRIYGEPVSARQILIDGSVHRPRAARELDVSLTRYSPRGGQPFGQA